MRLIQKALTFDDVLLVPAYSAVLPRMLEPTASITSILSVLVNSQGLASKAYGLDVKAPCIVTGKQIGRAHV